MSDMYQDINTLASMTEKATGATLPRVSAYGAAPQNATREYMTPTQFGNYLNQHQNWVNEFINAYGMVAYQVITSRVWENPLDFLFKKQEFGYGIEELFVNLAKPLAYDPWGKGEEQWQRVMPDVRNMMHVINIKTYVEQTVYDEGLRTAFTSQGEWDNMKDQIVASVTDGLSVALYGAAKYLMALYAIETGVITISIPDYVSNPSIATEELQVASDEMTFKKPDYNPAGVYNFCPKNRQYLFVTPRFNAKQSVEVLAYMFQIQEGELPQRKILIDNFWEHDYDTLNEMFVGGVPHVFTDEEVTALKQVPALMCADDLFMFYNQVTRWEAPWNSKKLYWNYMHHWQGTMSYSPFACGVCLYTGTPGNVTSIFNPYGTTEITMGRDNLTKILQAHTVGLFSTHAFLDGVVSGDGLIALEDHPGWYQASNHKGDTATITYTYEGDDISSDALPSDASAPNSDEEKASDSADDAATSSLTLTINITII